MWQSPPGSEPARKPLSSAPAPAQTELCHEAGFLGKEDLGKTRGLSWSLSIATQPAQGCKGVLGHRRALGPPSPRDGQTQHLPEENFLATSP